MKKIEPRRRSKQKPKVSKVDDKEKTVVSSPPSYKACHEAIDRAARQRNFGEATRQMYKLRQSALKPRPISYLKYIKACIRCGQQKVALAYKDHLIRHNQPLKSDVSRQLHLIFLRGYCEALDMVRAYELIRGIDASDISEPVVQEWLRGALRAGWVFEGLALIRLVDCGKLKMTTVESIVELISSIADRNDEGAMELVQIQRRWLARGESSTLVSDLLAQLRCHLLIMRNSPTIDSTDELNAVTLIEKIKVLLRDIKAEEVTDDGGMERVAEQNLPEAEDLAASIINFWKHKLSAYEEEWLAIKSGKGARGKSGKQLFLYKAVDHVIDGMSHLTWSNRAHPNIWRSIYAIERLHPPAPGAILQPHRLPANAEDFCRSLMESVTNWESHSSTAACQKIERRITKRLRLALETPPGEGWAVELGAGDGDWASTQQFGKFVVNELRWNRCAHIRWKLDQSNINRHRVLIGGDGTRVCADYLSNSCDLVQINFPEPPSNRDDPDNWISAGLFETLRMSLRIGGRVKFITDQRSLVEYVDAFIIRPQLRAGLWTSAAASQSLWNFTQLTDVQSLADLATSFFGKLWERGHKSYFLLELQRSQ